MVRYDLVTVVMRSREKCSPGLQSAPYSCIRYRDPTIRCLVESRAKQFENSDRGIVQHNHQMLMVHLDVGELDYEGEVSVFDGDKAVGKQYEYKGSVCVNIYTGKILAVGKTGSLDPSLHYSEDTDEIGIMVAQSEESENYWFVSPVDAMDEPINWIDFMSERACYNLQNTLDACNDPTFASN